MIVKKPYWRYLIAFSCYCWLSSFTAVNALPTEDIPTNLQAWADWVLYDVQNQDCPSYYNATRNKTAPLCFWPSYLILNVNANQAEFNQKWHVYHRGWVTLPGDSKNWPQSVKINGESAVVADINGKPNVFTNKGEFLLQGKFQFAEYPDFLQIPAPTGLVTLSINNQAVAIPNLDKQGRLWLRQNGKPSEVKKNVKNRLDMRVYRHIIDDIPLQMETRIELEIAGQHREVLLGPVLLAKQQAMSIQSSLPTRLETDGNLRLQVRPGSWTLILKTRQLGIVKQLKLETSAKDNWVDKEIWVFEARNQLRLTEIHGVNAIDPQQTSLPNQWRRFPAYQITPKDVLEIVEKRRGDPDPVPDQLNLQRNFWLDFDGQGYTVQDNITGTMTRSWRLEMESPTELGRVAVNGKNQFITRLETGGNTGVEVRRGNVNLVAESRLDSNISELPAVGWEHDFQSAAATLHLPPGWTLFNAGGIDSVTDTWLQQWTLLDLFIVLILAVAVGKLWNFAWGGFTLIAMILIYHEAPATHFIWLNIIASLALLRVLPALGWMNRLAIFYRNANLVILLIIALPFMMQQMRQSIYPQLEYAWKNLETNNYYATNQMSQEITTATGSSYDEEYEPLKKMLPSAPMNYQIAKSDSRTRASLVQIDPDAQVQTGPGLPKWEWRTIEMDWNGPVHKNQSIQLWLISPMMNSILNVIRVILLAILIAFFLWVSFKSHPKPFSQLTNPPSPKNKQPNLKTSEFIEKCPNKKASSSISIWLLVMGLLLTFPFISHADGIMMEQNNPKSALINNDFPPQYLLKELKQRLLEQPKCLPYCASNPRLSIELEAQQLNIRMEIHTLDNVAVPLPGIASQWLPQQVLINGEPVTTVLRDNKEQLWVNIDKGVHQIQLAGPLANRNTIQLPLPLHPRLVEVKANGWRVEGVHENGIADNQLQFTRQQATDDKQLLALEMGSLPPFVQIERTLLLGLDWQVITRIIRKTPLGSAIVLEIPLLQGESVTSEAIRVVDGKVLVNMSPARSQISWTSVLDKQETITLIATDHKFSHETWRLDASAIWHIDIHGIPPIHHQNKGRWLPTWQPWAGEKVILQLSRPKGVAGQVLTIDRSQLTVTPGHRTTDNKLLLNLRSSRGMQHKIILPENAQLQSVFINNKSQPIRQEGRHITLPIIPGTQNIELRFQQPIGMQQYFHTPIIDLGIDSVNMNIEVKMPTDRWILFVGGEPIGPAVMIWGILIVMALVAIGLGQITLTPLNTLHWLLLGLVLSQLPAVAMIFIVAWFMILGWRGNISPNMSALKFNLMQIGIILLTIIAMGILLQAIQQGLLGHPNMHIAGNGSSADSLNWYTDRITILPEVWVFSVSMWIYRIAMLLWALWLAFALLRWLRWGWNCFSQDYLWKSLTIEEIVRPR
ncbi:MAG: hypothetical protein KAH84_00625 [Thiomargarita sp.]|nr:hypothetical protein [Thiomargarita sp.]